jgi:hypothetical protein
VLAQAGLTLAARDRPAPVPHQPFG